MKGNGFVLGFGFEDLRIISSFAEGFGQVGFRTSNFVLRI